MNINDASTTSAISHVPVFRMNLSKFQGIFRVMRRMRNISVLCLPHHFTNFQLQLKIKRFRWKLTRVVLLVLQIF